VKRKKREKEKKEKKERNKGDGRESMKIPKKEEGENRVGDKGKGICTVF